MENKKNIPVPVFFAAIWVLIRLTLHTLKVPSEEKIGVYLNLLLVLITVFASLNQKIRLEKKLERYAVNFKHCLKNAGIYIIIVVGFIVIHHKFINPDYLQDRKIERIESAEKDYDLFKGKSPALEGLTKADFMERAVASSEIFSSITVISTVYFLGLFFMSLFSSIFIPIIYKKLVLRM